MDKKIPVRTQRKEKLRQLVKIGLPIIVLAFITIGILHVYRPSISKRFVKLSKVDKGDMQVSISASGTVCPIFEEIIASPINSRITKLYCHGGEKVQEGTPLMQLDLQATETKVNQMIDEKKMRLVKLNQLQVNNQTTQANLKMQIKVAGMKLEHLKVKWLNEKYLDSIGAGTQENVAQAHLGVQVGELELQQMREQYKNECDIAQAEEQVQQLSYSMLCKDILIMQHTLSQAKVKAPHTGYLTYINEQIGANVQQGTQLAVISDLSKYKIQGAIADTFADKIHLNSPVIVCLDKEELAGSVTSITPLSKNGMIHFIVHLAEANHPKLQSGLKTDINIMSDTKTNIKRIDYFSSYQGPGEYTMFIADKDNCLHRKKVTLGKSNYKHIEVIKGLAVNDQVAINDMHDFEDRKTIYIK